MAKKRICLLLLLVAVVMTVGAEPSKGFRLRLMNHWDNPDGTVERGYAGRSLWKWDEIPVDPRKSLPKHLRKRYEEYGRRQHEYGINGTVLNNVNAKPLMLKTDMLQRVARIADILRPYGVRVYLSVNFASPKALGELATADPTDKRVQEWWQRKADEIYALIPDFGGFLVKANSEGEPGPADYGRSHAEGANMLASALNKYGGIVIWRAFVYAPTGDDRASQAFNEFVPLDGQFADNVILQIKNGPIDFQPREPVSPLFFAMKRTRMMAELQITQEYTGHSIHTCFLVPMWHDFFAQLAAQGVQLEGVAGVANTGDTENWTANPLALANWYGFGRLACNPTASPRQIAEDFLRENYTNDARFVAPVTDLLLRSHEALVDYMMPMGLHHIFAADHHYGPEPWCERKGWREDWLPRYYHRADSIGIGFNRSDHAEPCVAGKQGSNNVAQYPEPLRSRYNNVETCPESLLLWFHHVAWDYRMEDGQTLWEHLCRHYDRGVTEAQDFVRIWQQVRPFVDRKRYEEQLWRFQRQADDAQWWHDACLLYFQTFSRMPLPSGSLPTVFTLKELQAFRLKMDNYSAPNPQALPQVQRLRLPQMFGDGMVLQRGVRIPVWGWAAPNSTIRVELNGRYATTKASEDGKWEVWLPKMQAGGPYELTVGNLKIHNVLIGDVFLCSGQSNMELPIRRCMDSVASLVKDYSNPRIRYLKIPHQYNYLHPSDDMKVRPWQDITPENCGEVSALCYFMARELQERYDVPIGIINSAVGGTQVQAWMPRETLETFNDFAEEFLQPRHIQPNWVDSVSRLEQRAAHEWDMQTNACDSVLYRWNRVGYDFASWQSVGMFDDWSHGHNGSYWFRTIANIPKELAGQPARLRFGAMKDADSIFINGHFIGNTTYEYPPRIYDVPADLLRAGENDIVVHLISQNGLPHFNPGKRYQLEVGEHIIPLADTLQMAVGCKRPERPRNTYFVDCPAALYNAMIAPLRQFPFRGIVWYQGESNIDTPHRYADYLAALAASWRQQFKRKLPFVIVQLPSYLEPAMALETGWTQIQQEQYLASQNIPKSTLVPLMDTGDAYDIHPQDKHIVGHRVAQQIIRLAYNEHLTIGPM
ncbi:MAG: hypothetical protein IKU02_01700 [Bacteroidaceae bacterium]|nr:hypothetical protein [Bacteroidaceae bacterium]